MRVWDHFDSTSPLLRLHGLEVEFATGQGLLCTESGLPHVLLHLRVLQICLSQSPKVHHIGQLLEFEGVAQNALLFVLRFPGGGALAHIADSVLKPCPNASVVRGLRPLSFLLLPLLPAGYCRGSA